MDTSLSPETLYTLLAKVPHPVRLDDVLRIIGVKRRAKREVLDLLTELVHEGKLQRLPNGRWLPAGNTRTLFGVLSVQRGAAFVSPLSPEALRDIGEGPSEDIEAVEAEAEHEAGTPDLDALTALIEAAEQDEKPRRNRKAHTPEQIQDVQADIFISPYALNNAFHGDTVEVALDPARPSSKSRRHAEGRVLRVVREGTSELTVRASVVRTSEGMVCTPLDDRYPPQTVDISTLPEPPKDGDIMEVRVEERLGPGLWRAVALRVLGAENSVDVQEKLVRVNLHIPEVFPPNVLAAAEHLEKQTPAFPCTDGPLDRNTPERRDLRHLPLVTIDGADARDFDDAVAVEKLPEGRFILWVAIADVGHYVTREGGASAPGATLDAEATRRGTSVYFPRSVIPMLPEILSNNLCSLRPHEDRPVMVARMLFTAEGAPLTKERAFYPGLMRSRARLTYEAVQAMLDGKGEALADGQTDAAIPAEVRTMLGHAAELAGVLMTRRSARGGLDLDLPEAQFDFDDAGKLLGVRSRERLFSHRLIEAFMLAANEAVAEYLMRRRVAFPLRVHPAPDSDRVRSLFRVLKATGVPLPAGAHAAERKPGLDTLSQTLHDILEGVRETPQAPLVNRLLLRTLMQARYAAAPLPPAECIHFGLASQAYCHFTSPIRRYPDLLVHRALKRALRHSDLPLPGKRERQHLGQLCDTCNMTERRAQEAERDIHRRLACMALEPRVGEVFTGLITSVNPFGLFVEPEGVPADGLIRVESLPDDWYEYDEDRQELIGQARGLRFSLGQTVVVRLFAVRMDRLEIDFVLDGAEPGRRGQPPARRNVPRRNAQGRASQGTEPPRRSGTSRSGSQSDSRTGGRPENRPGSKRSGTRKGESGNQGNQGKSKGRTQGRNQGRGR